MGRESRVRRVRAIAAETEAAFSPDALRPPHPLDEEEDEPPLDAPPGVYLGAAGVIWALTSLSGRASSSREGAGPRWRRSCRSATSRTPTSPTKGSSRGSCSARPGSLLVAHGLAPARQQEETLLEVVRGNVDNPALELMWGAPGTMLATRVMLERTGNPIW